MVMLGQASGGEGVLMSEVIPGEEAGVGARVSALRWHLVGH